MAASIGTPGNSASIRAILGRYFLPIALVFLAVIMLPTFVNALIRNFGLGLASIVVGVAVSAYLYRAQYREMIHEFRSARKWKQGAEGEMLVGDVLAKLPDTYVVFHDYKPIDSNGKPTAWNVDHIVIGPTGVFVVETKNYSQARVTPAAKNQFTRKNVKQVDGNAIEFKKQLVAWSGGKLADQFVQPLLVYTQANAYVEQPFEGRVKVIPLKWLEHDITARTGNELDPDSVYRIARVLHTRLIWDFRELYRPELDRFGHLSKEFKLDRAAGRAQTSSSDAGNGVESESEAPADSSMAIPTHCPRCGAPLVRRIASKGPREGMSFMGCSRYGRTGCRYVHNLAE